MCVGRLLLSREFELSTDHIATRGTMVDFGRSRIEIQAARGLLVTHAVM